MKNSTKAIMAGVAGLILASVMYRTRESNAQHTPSIVMMHSQASTGGVTLGWDATTDPEVTGYNLYYGTAPRVYGTPVPVAVPSHMMSVNLAAGTYFFAVTARNALGVESQFSSEVSAVVTQGASPTPTPVITATPAKTPSPAPTVTPSPSSTPFRTPSPSPAKTPSPAPGGPVITTVNLVQNNPGGKLIMALVNGSVINLSSLPTQNVNVEATSSIGASGSIRFILDNLIDHTEANSPFAMCGDWTACPANTITRLGNHMLTMRAASSSGVLGPDTVITFTVTSSAPTASPRPSPIPTASPAPTRSPSPSPSVTPSCTPCPCGNPARP